MTHKMCVTAEKSQLTVIGGIIKFIIIVIISIVIQNGLNVTHILALVQNSHQEDFKSFFDIIVARFQFSSPENLPCFQFGNIISGFRDIL